MIPGVCDWQRMTGSTGCSKRGHHSLALRTPTSCHPLSQLRLCGRQVPTVLIVVQGGPNTLKLVRSSLERDSPVVVIKGSGGCADMVTRIVENLRECPETMGKARWDTFKQELDLADSKPPQLADLALGLAKVAMQKCGVAETKRHELVHMWSPDAVHQGSFDTVVLDAIVSFYKLREDKWKIETERMKRHKQLLPLTPTGRAPHTNARGRQPPGWRKVLPDSRQ